MDLYIDTTDFNRLTFALTPSLTLPTSVAFRRRGSAVSPPLMGGARGGWKVAKKSYKIDPHKSHETLSKLDEFLKSQKIKFPQPSSGPPAGGPPSPTGRRKIEMIYTNKGPGSFTGTRVGVAHTLALGFGLNVPVKFLSKIEFEKFQAK